MNEGRTPIILWIDSGYSVYDKSGNYLCVITAGNFDAVVPPAAFDDTRAKIATDLVSRGVSVDDLIKLKTAGIL